MSEEITGENLKNHLIKEKKNLQELNDIIEKSIMRQKTSAWYEYNKKEVDEWICKMERSLEQNGWLIQIIENQLMKDFNYSS